MTRSLAIVLGLLVSACAGGAIPHPNEASVSWARAEWPGSSRQSLEQGRELYVARCSGCHTLHEPRSYRAERWRDVVGVMAPRARLSPSESDLVLRYLLTMSRGPAGGAARTSAR
jgi:hypothetical protein